MTTTEDIEDFFTKIILDQIEKTAQAKRFGRTLTRTFDLSGEPTESITIAMETEITLPDDIDEGDSVIPSKVSFTPKEIKLTERWAMGISVSEESILDCKFDLISSGVDRVGRGFAVKEDSFIFSTLLASTKVEEESLSGLGSGIAYQLANFPLLEILKVVYDSTEATPTSIDYTLGKFKLSQNCTGNTVKVTYTYTSMALTEAPNVVGTLTYEDILDALYQCKEVNEEPTIMVVNPRALKDLLKDNRFIDVSRYGSSTPIQKGEMGTIASLKLLTTTQIPESCALILDKERFAYLLTKGSITQRAKEEASSNSRELYFFMREGASIVNSKSAVLVLNIGSKSADMS